MMHKNNFLPLCCNSPITTKNDPTPNNDSMMVEKPWIEKNIYGALNFYHTKNLVLYILPYIVLTETHWWKYNSHFQMRNLKLREMEWEWKVTDLEGRGRDRPDFSFLLMLIPCHRAPRFHCLTPLSLSCPTSLAWLRVSRVESGLQPLPVL